MKKTMLGIFVVVGVGLAACSSPAVSAPTFPQVQDAEVPVPTAEKAPERPTTGTWGEQITWEDGIAVIVTAPVPFTPSKYAAGNDGERAVLIKITVLNNSKNNYDFNNFVFGPTATFNGSNISTITDLQNLDYPSSNTVLPGKNFSYSVAYSITKKEGDLQLEFQSDFMSEKAIYTGKV